MDEKGQDRKLHWPTWATWALVAVIGSALLTVGATVNDIY